MQNLVPIGRFSQLTQLSIKALRLYDKMGLLPPAMIDFPSGFRYYSQDQVPTAAHIRLLRLLEMPLDDIRALLNARDADDVQQRLASHRRWLEERISAHQQALILLQAFADEYMTSRKGRPMKRDSKPYRCSFCGKENADVRRMIAGPNGVFICDACVSKCNEIIAQEEAHHQQEA